ncbi:glycosyltransferase family 1 protein [Geobacillus sp. FSL W8-0466]|uniref:glycosyltransferase family 4 protein n=1 Tax=Geobacillus sp. FSL W8-0466 TaxID=2975350 RepID=UPI0030DBF8C7
MKTTIYINGRFLTQSITGVQRYAFELIHSLDNIIGKNGKLQANFEFIILTPKKIKHNLRLENIRVKKIGVFKGHLWEQINLPFLTSGRLLINLCNTAPILKRYQLVTIHDANVYANPRNFSLLFRLWYKFLFKIISKKSKKLITVSNFSKSELEHYLNINNNKIKVIYEGKEQILNINSEQNILRKHNLQCKRYLLAVSSLSPNKNFKSVIQAIQLLKDIKVDIVIAGGTNPKVFSDSRDIGKTANVKYIGYVSDNELKSLYENAAGFIYPSFYEGFGLPPLEAMACGCPVIVSNVASLPEVCGDAALYIDPYSPEDIAEKIKLLLSDDKLRKELRRKGLERAKMFSWEKCAEETIKVIEEVLAK